MILLIQNGYVTPCLPKYLDEEYLIVKSFEIDVSKLPVDKYSLIIILGGFQSVTNIVAYKYLSNVVELIKRCFGLDKAILGICLGCQMIAFALGCKIKSTDKLNIGYDTTILNKSNIFRCHTDYFEPNDSTKIIEWFEGMPYYFKYRENIIGIQCHPDISPDCVQRYSNNNECNEYAKNHRDEINENNKEIISFLIKVIRKKIE